MSATAERFAAEAVAEVSPARRRAVDVGGLLIAANCVAILAVAAWMRCWRLTNIPGANGDEAWYGVQALRVLAGESIAWTTPTGNPVNPFYFGPLLLIHSLFPPSFGLLRSVAAASGLLALVLNFALCRRVFGMRTAVVSTVLLAVLPINIAYSRFAWDASQSLAATIPVLYLPLLALRDPGRRGRLLSLGVAAALAAVLVHPTNVFATPIVAAAVFFMYRSDIATVWMCSRAIRRFALGLALLLAVGCVAWRMASQLPADGFLLNYVRLFSGATVYRFIPGSIAGTELDWFDLCGAGVVLAGFFGFARLVKIEGLLADRALAWGSALGCATFYLIAGPGGIGPHFERYGICLVAPGALMVSRGGCWLWSQAGKYRRAVDLAYVAIAWSLIPCFWIQYLNFFERTGGESHRTFQTAATEPKLQSLEYVLSRCQPGEPVAIVADEWWNYWPVAYLAHGRQGVRVVSASEPALGAVSQSDGCNWFIEFSGAPAEQKLLEQFGRIGVHAERKVIFDYAGRPGVSIYGPIRKCFPNN